MSYGASRALQIAIYDRLVTDGALAAIVGDEIHDGMPAGPLPGLYVSLGEETVTDRSDISGAGARHEFTVSVVSDANGFSEAKAAAGAISDALLRDGLTPDRGRIVGIWFRRAVARRVQGNLRRIDLRFRAQIEDNIQ